MFRYFWLKFGFILFSIMLFFVCAVFLIFNHNDNLKNYVPAEAEIYLHSKPRQYKSLPPNQKNFYLNWLEAHSSLSKSAWQSLLQNHNGEIGLFSINEQVFGVIKSKKAAIDALNAQGVSFVRDGEALFFPSLHVSEEKLKDRIWFQKISNRISFADILIYVKDNLSLPLPILEIAAEPMRAAAEVSPNRIKLRISGPVGQKLKSKNKRQITGLPSNAVLYFYNILTKNISEKAEFSAQNFKFHLLQSLAGPVEFLEAKGGFTIFAPKKFNSFESIEKSILTILANTLPVEKQKFLPDQTVSTQLIADPSRWQFQNNITDNRQVSHLEEKKLNLTLSVEDLDELIVIKNNALTSNPNLLAKINQIVNSCSLFHNNGLIILPFNNVNNFKELVIINKNPNNIVLCIH